MISLSRFESDGVIRRFPLRKHNTTVSRMMRIGPVVALLSLGFVGCHRGSADCPSGAQLQGKKPPAGHIQWCARPDGIKQGPWREWHANGNPKSAGNYLDGKMDGKWQTF